MHFYIAQTLCYLGICLVVIACGDTSNPQLTTVNPPSSPGIPTTEDVEGWLIPREEIFEGGPGKNGIPAIDNPRYVDVEEGNAFLTQNEPVVGIVIEGQPRAYPHRILDWHEIVNDNFGETAIAITYCPLTGTASAWNRTTSTGNTTTFGVSGLLYNSNMIAYDRETDSHWSQMQLKCVQGTLQGERVEMFQVVETSWKTWKKMYPNTEVLSTNSGFSRDYNRYPYGDYRTNHSSLLFPIGFEDKRRPAKERVHGIIDDSQENAQVFTLFTFEDSLGVVRESWRGRELLVAGSRTDNFIVSFYIDDLSQYESLSFEPTATKALPIIMRDNEGNEWDVFGRAVSGPREGQRLTPTRSYMGFFFAWGAFYVGQEIHE